MNNQLDDLNERFLSYQETTNEEITTMTDDMDDLNQLVSKLKDENSTLERNLKNIKIENEREINMIRSNADRDIKDYIHELKDKNIELNTYRDQNGTEISELKKRYEKQLKEADIHADKLNNKVIILIDSKKAIQLELIEYKRRLSSALHTKPTNDFMLDSNIMSLKKQIDNEIDSKKSTDLRSTKKMIDLEVENYKLKSIKSMSSSDAN